MDVEEEELYDENDDMLEENEKRRFQSRNIYTKLMPNPEQLDQQADYWFDWIKINIPRCIEANEIRYESGTHSVPALSLKKKLERRWTRTSDRYAGR